MILELDCGNSLIKWRILRCSISGVAAAGAVGSAEELISCLTGLTGVVLSAGRMVSVRSDDETQALASLLNDRFSIEMHIARSGIELAGVRNGYSRPEMLGGDRWLAVAAAYRLSAGACVVFDLGTAVTADLVDADGGHLGGFIAPGVAMMRSQLCSTTQLIRGVGSDGLTVDGKILPGHSTSQAVEGGCLLMLRGFVAEQLNVANEYLPGNFDVFLTGGDAGLIEAFVPGARVVPDLVFRGLELACPLEES